MKKVISILIVVVMLSSFLTAQDFLKGFDFGYPAMSFVNTTVENDTIICIGIARDSVAPFQQGALFTKIDTCGDVLMSHLFIDSLDHFFVSYGNNIVKTKKNGYAFAGGLGAKKFIMELDHEGNQIMLNTFDSFLDTSAHYLAVITSKLIEIENGYLLIGLLQYEDFTRDIFMLKTNEAGEEVSWTTFGEVGLNDVFASFYQPDNQTIIIGAGKYSGSIGGNPSGQWLRTWIFAIDTSGQMLWEWIDPDNSNTVTTRGLHPTPDGGWIYAGYYRDTTVTLNNITFTKGIITKLKQNMEIDWKVILDEPTYVNGFYDLKPDGEGHFVAAGHHLAGVGNMPSSPRSFNSWIVKVSLEGDTLWTRKDGFLWHEVSGTHNEIYGVDILSNNSIVAVGSFITFGDNSRISGLLIKTNKDGTLGEAFCEIPIDTTTTTMTLLTEANPIVVFPNPVRDNMTLQCEVCEQDKVDFMLYNAMGQLVLEKKLNRLKEQEIYLKGLERGVYFYNVSTKRQLIGSGKLLKE